MCGVEIATLMMGTSKMPRVSHIGSWLRLLNFFLMQVLMKVLIGGWAMFSLHNLDRLNLPSRIS